MQQNVVTYATVIDVPNQQLKLKPGMTANVNVEIARSSNAVRVPNAALRFRPTTEIYAALGLTPPDPSQVRGEFGGRGGERGTPPSATPAGGGDPAPSSSAGQSDPSRPTTPPPVSGDAATFGARGDVPALQRADSPNGEAGSESGGSARRRGLNGGDGRGSAMPPEERAQMMERMRGRGVDPTVAGSGASRRAGGRGAAPAASPTPKAAAASATTIDALFGPLPRVETTGRVWRYDGAQLNVVRLRLGITDGQNTEVIEGDLEPGVEFVTNISTATTTARPAATAFPGFGQPGRGGFGGAPGFGGTAGGGNRGGGR